MAKITYIVDGNERVMVDGLNGLSVMEVALQNGIEGIDADCLGSCSCATCHVVVDEEWADKVGPPNENEEGLLSELDGREPASRLSCQVKVLPELDGLVVKVAGHEMSHHNTTKNDS